MSYFNRSEIIPARPQRPLPYANILSATGLSRRALAAMYRRDGLFGRDSALTREEQATVHNKLAAVHGLGIRAGAAQITPRLCALIEYANALVAGGDATRERARVVREGLSLPAISEVETVIEDAFVVFGAETVAPVAIPAEAFASPVLTKAA